MGVVVVAVVVRWMDEDDVVVVEVTMLNDDGIGDIVCIGVI